MGTPAQNGGCRAAVTCGGVARSPAGGGCHCCRSPSPCSGSPVARRGTRSGARRRLLLRMEAPFASPPAFSAAPSRLNGSPRGRDSGRGAKAVGREGEKGLRLRGRGGDTEAVGPCSFAAASCASSLQVETKSNSVLWFWLFFPHCSVEVIWFGCCL